MRIHNSHICIDGHRTKHANQKRFCVERFYYFTCVLAISKSDRLICVALQILQYDELTTVYAFYCHYLSSLCPAIINSSLKTKSFNRIYPMHRWKEYDIFELFRIEFNDRGQRAN